MKSYRIKSAEALCYPVVRVTFDDGLSGEVDLGEQVATGASLAPLKDESYFRTVAVAQDGRAFGWNLADEGHEIDFCPDATRIRIETAIVEDLASRYREHRTAAE